MENVPENALLGRQVLNRQWQAPGSLNPAWTAWLMGWPIGWEDVSLESQWECPLASTACAHLATVRCLSRWLQRGRYWLRLLVSSDGGGEVSEKSTIWPTPQSQMPGAGSENSKVKNLLTGSRHSFYLTHAVEAEQQQPGVITDAVVKKKYPPPTVGDSKSSGSRVGNPNTQERAGTSLTDAIVREA